MLNFRRLRPTANVAKSPSRRRRKLRVESLESRQLLAASLGSESPGADSSVIGSDELHTADRFEVTAVVLSINGEAHSFDVDGIIPLQAGDELQVAGIEYAAGQEIEGVLAIESYISKLPESNEASVIDYTDGRFGGGEEIAFGPGTHGGVDGTWTVEEGWDRLTISLVRYFGDSSQIENTSRLRLQVGKPDFVIDDAMIDQVMSMDYLVGEQVDFSARWANAGLGRYHNYLEIDVSHLDSGELDWVGVSVANVDSKGVDEHVENHNANDRFDVSWTPLVAGDYEVLIAVDPEHMWDESDETNNRVKLHVTVAEPPSLQNVIFALDREGRIATHNTESGDTKFIGQADVSLSDIAISPNRKMYAVSFTSVYSVDMKTGQATLIGETDRSDLNSLAFLADGTLVASGYSSDELFEVDLLTGALESIGKTGHLAAGDLAVHDGVLQMSTTKGKLVAIKIEDGVVAQVDEIAKVKKDIYGISSSDKGMIVSRGNRLFNVDTNGKLRRLTNLGPLDFSTIYGLASINQS